MSSVTFSTSVGGDGSTVTDDNNAMTGLKEGGWKTRFVPALTQEIAVASFVVNAALTVLGGATTNSTSLTSLAIATGSKSLTLAESGKAYTIGQYVIIASTATPANNMIGQVTAFSGTSLVVNVTAINGSGTVASWSVSVTGAPSSSVPVSATINGRLTLTTATPVTTTDVLAATTVYFTPYNGNQIATYSGSAWSINTFTEKSVAVPATTSTPFDVFIVDATLALETVNWTNDTTRATALVLQDGIHVKSGATTRRYLGTGRTTTASGQCEDSLKKRYLWNVSNRLIRNMLVNDLTGAWTYTTNTMRQANGSTANQLDFVIGVSEVPVLADLQCAVRNTGGVADFAVAIGLDVTNSTSSNITSILYGSGTGISYLKAVYTGFPSAGRHFLAWLEVSEASATTTWYGATRGLGVSLGGTSNINLNSGITGTIYG